MQYLWPCWTVLSAEMVTKVVPRALFKGMDQGPCSNVFSVGVLVEAALLVPGALLDNIVSRSTSGGSTGSTRGLVGQYCQ